MSCAKCGRNNPAHVAKDDAIRAVRVVGDIHRAFREFAEEQRKVVGDVALDAIAPRPAEPTVRRHLQV